MASLWTSPAGTHRIQFIDPIDGSRQAIYLTNATTKKLAKEFKLKVETLVSFKAHGIPADADTSRWLADIGDDVHEKLVDAGLATKRIRPESFTLGGFVSNYIDGRTDVKPRTRINLDQARKRMVAYFGESKLLQDITPGDADNFLIYLRGKYAEATAARVLKRARQFFTAAQRAKLVTENAFEGIKPGRMENDDRLYFVSHEDTQKILDKCPNAEWRAIVALCRYAGMRCPSELLMLAWDDCLWDINRIRIFSPKLEGTKKAERQIPMFPELMIHINALWNAADPGKFVITKSRDPGVNWRTTFTKIIRRAGLTPWPRLFQNLRSSRETELVERFPVHVVAYWLGNSPTVATKHYLQVRDSDFDAAIKQGFDQVTHQTTHRGAFPIHSDSHGQFPAPSKTLEKEPEKVVGVNGSDSAIDVGDAPLRTRT